jgi:hypothetical protein
MTILTNGVTPVEFVSSPTLPDYVATDDLPVGLPRLAVMRTGPRDVFIDPTAMDVDQPYGYRLEGAEFVVYRRSDGRLDFYALPSRR